MIYELAVGTWTCALHIYHAPRPLRGYVHHIWPLGAGGPDTASNRASVCATGHDSVHAVMWELVNGRPAPACARKELAMATSGVAQWEAAGKPGAIRAFMA